MMTDMGAWLGINCGSPKDSDPAAIAATGATLVRTVYRDTIRYRPWLTELLRRGVDCLFVGDSSPESLSDNEGQWAARMTAARSSYGDLVRHWQWGNEPDGDGAASWTMSWQRVNRLLAVARMVFPSDDYTLIAPGMVTGNPDWLQNLRLDLCDGVDAHPYNKWVGTSELDNMLDGYLAYGKPLYCLEYDSRTMGMGAYLRDYPGIAGAAVMAWDDAQTDGEGLALGLKQNQAAMADFKAASAAGGAPAEQHATFQLGFAEWAAKDGALLGQPLENERGGVPGFSVQKTSTGRLMACNLVGRGWTLTLWRDSDGSRWLYQDGRSVQIA